MSTRDELAGVLADTINKQFKDMKVAYFLDGTDTTPTDIKDFVSTGSTMLDLAISNKPHGGIAVGRITELNGLESSGKSLLGAHMLAETQKKGGVAVYIDTETAVSTEFLGSIGADVVEAHQIGGSIKKGQIGHFIMSIAKTLEQKESGRATIAVLKSRFGKDGVIFEDCVLTMVRFI